MPTNHIHNGMAWSIASMIHHTTVDNAVIRKTVNPYSDRLAR